MENATIMLLIFGAVAVGMGGQAWASYLEHQRRRQTLDVIKAAIEAGKEPPLELYALLRKDTALKAPWGEVLVFGVMSLGFWLAFALGDNERRTAFLIVAITMTVTALGCLALAIAKPGHSRGDEQR